MTPPTFIFECSSNTYLDCVEKNLFGSNKPWPLEIKTGDYCLLHHYEIGGLLGLWQATCDGGHWWLVTVSAAKAIAVVLKRAPMDMARVGR